MQLDPGQPQCRASRVAQARARNARLRPMVLKPSWCAGRWPERQRQIGQGGPTVQSLWVSTHLEVPSNWKQPSSSVLSLSPSPSFTMILFLNIIVYLEVHIYISCTWLGYCFLLFFSFFLSVFIYLAVLSLRFVRGLSLVAASGGHFFIMVRGPLFIAVRGPLTIAAPPVAGHRLQTRRLSSCGSRAQSLRGMWDLPRPGLEPVSPALAGRFSTTAPPGKPRLLFKGNNCLLENYCPQESSVESSTDRFRGWKLCMDTKNGYRFS